MDAYLLAFKDLPANVTDCLPLTYGLPQESPLCPCTGVPPVTSTVTVTSKMTSDLPGYQQPKTCQDTFYSNL